MSSHLPEPYQLLLVEDDPGDSGLIRQVLRHALARARTIWVRDNK